MKNQIDRERKNSFVRKNGQIRHRRVLVVHDGQKLGEMSSRDAQQKANELGLDLVEVAPHARPPVCSIMDHGKFLYEQSKKKNQNKTSAVKEKEFVLRYVIDDNDLLTKMNQARKYLEKGDRVKLVIKFKARENAHRDKGMVVMKRAVDMLSDIGSPEIKPKFEGNRIIAKLKKD